MVAASIQNCGNVEACENTLRNLSRPDMGISNYHLLQHLDWKLDWKHVDVCDILIAGGPDDALKSIVCRLSGNLPLIFARFVTMRQSLWAFFRTICTRMHNSMSLARCNRDNELYVLPSLFRTRSADLLGLSSPPTRGNTTRVRHAFHSKDA